MCFSRVHICMIQVRVGPCIITLIHQLCLQRVIAAMALSEHLQQACSHHCAHLRACKAHQLWQPVACLLAGLDLRSGIGEGPAVAAALAETVGGQVAGRKLDLQLAAIDVNEKVPLPLQQQ